MSPRQVHNPTDGGLIEVLREFLSYDPITGEIRWKKRPSPTIGAGEVAGNVANDGYVKFRFRGRLYMAHRVAIAFETGSWPDQFVDHVNRDRSDNRLSNLRAATPSQNNRNRVGNYGAVSKFKGVFLQGNRWRARIRHGETLLHLGYFASEEAAARAYDAAAAKLYGDFAKLNLPEVRHV